MCCGDYSTEVIAPSPQGWPERIAEDIVESKRSAGYTIAKTDPFADRSADMVRH
jgi:hypothetical protein